MLVAWFNTYVLLYHTRNLAPCCLLEAFEHSNKVVDAHLLRLKHFKVELVLAGVAKNNTACLVVGCNNDECLVLVLLVELVGFGNGCVEVEHLVNHCGCIIPVRCVVNFAALYHHEETILLALLAKEIYSGLCNLCKCQVVGSAVNGIRNLLGNVLLVEHHLLCLLRLCHVVVISACNGIALLLGSAVEVTALFGSALCITAGIEVIAGLQHPLCNLVIVVAVYVVGIECRWGSVVDAHGGGNAHCHAAVLGMECNTVDIVALGVLSNAAVVRLAAC